MDIALIVVFILLGTVVGSFLNVCIDRLPLGKSIVRPPSYCDACQHRLAPIDLIPVFSYLWLRRRCRSCGALIPWRVFWVEVGTGTLFGFLYWYYMVYPTTSETVQLVVTAFYSCIFIVILGIDLEHQLILNRIVYPAVIVALLLAISLNQPDLVASAPPAFLSLPDVAARTVTGVTGGVTGFVLLLIPALVFPAGMGFGDVKMAGLIGLVVGFPLVFVAILGAIVVGGLVGGTLLLLKIKGRKDAIPFGPYLSLATIVTLLFGNNILSWYLGLFP
ncbi:MAG: prepilin peptidase [Dehalococcoidales bacterium]|nr:MAG: prepilin peptidase [Dehalococcoidales bacterium]